MLLKYIFKKKFYSVYSQINCIKGNLRDRLVPTDEVVELIKIRCEIKHEIYAIFFNQWVK